MSGAHVLTVRMDGAPELCEGHLGVHLCEHGIVLQVTAPYAHPQNGKAKHYIRTLENGMQTLLADAGLPFSFWGDAVCTFQYLRNHMPTSVLPSGITPFEAYKHKKPDLSHLRVWGCQCFFVIPPELRAKGGPRRYEAIFVGYEEDRVGWCVHDLKGAYHFSRNVIFNESVPGHLSSLRSSSHPSTSLPLVESPVKTSQRPVCMHIRTTAGKAYDANICACDAVLVSRHSQPSVDGGVVVPHSLCVIQVGTITDWPDLVVIHDHLYLDRNYGICDYI